MNTVPSNDDALLNDIQIVDVAIVPAYTAVIVAKKDDCHGTPVKSPDRSPLCVIERTGPGVVTNATE